MTAVDEGTGHRGGHRPARRARLRGADRVRPARRGRPAGADPRRPGRARPDGRRRDRPPRAAGRAAARAGADVDRGDGAVRRRARRLPRRHPGRAPGWRGWSRPTSATGWPPTSTGRSPPSCRSRTGRWSRRCSPTPVTPTSRCARCAQRSPPTQGRRPARAVGPAAGRRGAHPVPGGDRRARRAGRADHRRHRGPGRGRRAARPDHHGALRCAMRALGVEPRHRDPPGRTAARSRTLPALSRCASAVGEPPAPAPAEDSASPVGRRVTRRPPVRGRVVLRSGVRMARRPGRDAQGAPRCGDALFGSCGPSSAGDEAHPARSASAIST